MKKHILRFLTCLIAFIIGTAVYSLGAYYDGKINASTDLFRGKYQIRVYGGGGGSIIPYWRLLREKYGVQKVHVADCVVTREIAEEARGYNEVMKSAIEDRFGQDVFERTLHEAKELCDRNSDLEKIEN